MSTINDRVDTMEVVVKPGRMKRRHSEEFKQALVAACSEPGTSVSGVALANGINANQVRRWMRERGVTPPSRRPKAPAPVETASEFLPVRLAPAPAETPDIRIEVRRGNATINVQWPTHAARECAEWLRDWLK